jgi:hypothetical protein
LSADTETDVTPHEAPASPALKFDDSAADGLGNQLKPRYAVGSGSFTKEATGKVDRFTLTLDDDARAFVKGQMDKGGTIRLIVSPDSDDVAATYAGAAHPTMASRPILAIDAELAK